MNVFKRIATALVLTIPLMGAQCQSIGDDLAARIDALCKFVPTPGTISAIILKWNLQAGVAAAIIEQAAKATCDTVTAKKGVGDWYVTAPDGSQVKIEGEFKK